MVLSGREAWQCAPLNEDVFTIDNAHVGGAAV